MDETAEVVGGAHKKTSRQLEENGVSTLVGVAEAKLQSNGLDEDDAPVGGAECSSIEGSQLDAVLRWADRRGNYERLLVWAWVAPVCLLAPCAYLNILLMVYIPTRSCSLPPPPSSFSHDQWRNFTTPRDDSGELSSCSLYDFPAAMNDSWSRGDLRHDPQQELGQSYLAAAQAWAAQHPHTMPANYTTECVFGYDFDDTYFQETAATEFGWACGGAHAIQTVLHASVLGNLLGCVTYGPLADKVGRRKVFVVLAVKVALLGSLYVFVRRMWVVLVVRCLVSTGLPVLYQIVIISALEQVADERRGLVTSLSSIFFSVGQCLLAPVAWVTGHWVTLGLVTSLPALLALVYLRVIEESPRWLICQGRLKEASCVLRRVAHMNGFHVSHQHILTRLRKVCGSEKKQVTMTEGSHGPLHMMRLLVRYPRMAARTALVTICWTVNMILYYNTTMKYPYVFVNPFLGWFSISVMEVPANIMVLFLLKKVGRRPLHAGVMAISTASLLSAACVLALGYEERQTPVAVLVLVAKLSASMTFLVIYLQAAELHPTPVRTCATGLASLVAIACNIFSPTIVAMARPWHSYLLLGSLGLLGVLSASLLPETAGRPLPQTMDDAENFARRRSSSTSSSSSVRISPKREEGPTVFPSSPPPSVEVSKPISSSHLLGRVKETII